MAGLHFLFCRFWLWQKKNMTERWKPNSIKNCSGIFYILSSYVTVIILYSLVNTNCQNTKLWKELSLSHKLKFSNPNIFATWWCAADAYSIYSKRIYPGLLVTKIFDSKCHTGNISTRLHSPVLNGSHRQMKLLHSSNLNQA